MPNPSKVRRACLALAATALFFLVAEALLRIAGFSHEERDAPLVIWTGKKAWEFDKHDSLHVREPGTLWVPKAGVELPWSAGERVNARGYRGPEIELERRAGIARIATLGDSSTFGLGVDWPECWTARLGALLAERELPNEVLCGGVIAYTARQGLERYRELIRPYRPDVVIAAFGALNEHWSALGDSDDARIRASQRANSRTARTLRTLRNGLRTLHAVAYAVDWSTGRLDDAERSRDAIERSHEQADEAGRVDWEGTRRVTPEELADVLRVLEREVEADGGTLVLINMPRRPRAERVFPVLESYTEALSELATRESVPIYDARAAFRAYEGGEDLFLERDAVHPSVAGHERLAAGLAPLVAKILRSDRAASPATRGGTEQ